MSNMPIKLVFTCTYVCACTCTCVCICIYVCVCVYTYVCVCACACVCLCLCQKLCLNLCLCLYLCLCLSVLDLVLVPVHMSNLDFMFQCVRDSSSALVLVLPQMCFSVRGNNSLAVFCLFRVVAVAVSTTEC